MQPCTKITYGDQDTHLDHEFLCLHDKEQSDYLFQNLISKPLPPGINVYFSFIYNIFVHKIIVPLFQQNSKQMLYNFVNMHFSFTSIIVKIFIW